MKRSECAVDDLLATYVNELSNAGDWTAVMRLKWLMHRELAIQMNEDEIILRATKEKNKTL